MSILFSNNINENSKPHECIPCNYACKKKHHYEQHCLTDKHLKLANAVSNATTYQFQCEGCGRRYKERSGAWRHKQKCTVAVTTAVDQSMNYVDVIHTLLTDNQELRNFLIEQSIEHKKETAELMNRVVEISKPNMVNTINSNNKSFNINVFLNEHCKDALNLDQFMNGFEVSREDLMNTGRLGFVEGISKIFLDNLKMLSITKRPIHCTDAKRETIYITPTKEKNETNFINFVILLLNSVKAPRRALEYFTIIFL